MNDPVVTADLSKFGYRELEMAAELLKSIHHISDSHNVDGLTVNMNTNSGYVFLCNEDYDCFMMNGCSLEQFHSTPYGGVEGFFEDLVDQWEHLEDEDQEYVLAVMPDDDDWHECTHCQRPTTEGDKLCRFCDRSIEEAWAKANGRIAKEVK